MVKEYMEYIVFQTRMATFDCLPWLGRGSGNLTELGFRENIQALRLKRMIWAFNDGRWMD